MIYQAEPGSFRDRNGRVFYMGDEIWRALSNTALQNWETLSKTNFFRRYVEEGKLVPTEQAEYSRSASAPEPGGWAGYLRHEAIPFLSYPYEWPFGMLKDAAILQLELLLAALNEGMILKDSTPFNIQWVGKDPRHIDIPSFEILKRGEPWTGYHQFCKMFLYPLMLYAYKNVPFHSWIRGSIDGISSEHLNSLFSYRDLIRKGVFTNVFLQSKLERTFQSSKQNMRNDFREAGFSSEFIKLNVKRLKEIIGNLKIGIKKTEWSHYANNTSYTQSDQSAKGNFISGVMKNRRWKMVWDMGCNTGAYSKIASEYSDYVVAMDGDPLAVERLYQSVKADQIPNILPLVVNLADPSPSLGWRLKERKTLAERGKPEMILCLALIHHIVISANIPLNEFIHWLRETNSSLIIEFVTREDEMVQTLLRNKEDNYIDYDGKYFEKTLSASYTILDRKILKDGKRILYFAEPR